MKLDKDDFTFAPFAVAKSKDQRNKEAKGYFKGGTRSKVLNRVSKIKSMDRISNKD